MDRLKGIEAFVRVAETRSFAAAARALGVAPSVVTRRVQQLERMLKAPLFHRTSRSVQLSDTGAAFLLECSDLLRHTDQLVDRIRERQEEPTGPLRLHALPGFALSALGPVLRDFQALHPRVTFDVVVSDQLVDPIREGFDCTLQIFEPVHGTLVARRLFAWRPVFCAAPDYLAARGTPKKPADLLRHTVGLYSRYPTRDRFVFHVDGARGRRRQVELELEPALHTTSVHLLHDWGVAGAGIVLLPTLVAKDALLSGRLKAVLPDFPLDAFWLRAVYPMTHIGTRKLKLFLDGLAPRPVEVPPWEVELLARGLIPAAREPQP